MNAQSILLIAGTVAVMLILMQLWLWINSPRRSIERLHKKLLAGELPSGSEHTDGEFEIKLDAEGFTVVPGSDSAGSAISLQWDSVIEATAYKRDLFAIDQVCIAFRLGDHTEVEIHEQMRGWSEFCEALPIHLPGSPAWEDWFIQIMVPAFEPKPTTLFRRDMPLSESKLNQGRP